MEKERNEQKHEITALHELFSGEEMNTATVMYVLYFTILRKWSTMDGIQKPNKKAITNATTSSRSSKCAVFLGMFIH